MCNAGAAAMGAQAGGVAASTVGSYYSSVEKKASLKAQADMMELNAEMMDKSAKRSLRQGQIQEQKSRLQNRAAKDSNIASMAARGIDLGSESALAVLTTQDIFADIDAREIAKGALSQAFGYRSEAVNMRNNATTARGQSRGISPWMNAGTSLLTGASRMASSYAALKSQGAFGGKGGGSGGTDTEGGSK